MCQHQSKNVEGDWSDKVVCLATYVINLSHCEHVFKGGPVGWDWPSANGLVIGAATDRTFGKFAASETC